MLWLKGRVLFKHSYLFYYSTLARSIVREYCLSTVASLPFSRHHEWHRRKICPKVHLITVAPSLTNAWGELCAMETKVPDGLSDDEFVGADEDVAHGR